MFPFTRVIIKRLSPNMDPDILQKRVSGSGQRVIVDMKIEGTTARVDFLTEDDASDCVHYLWDATSKGAPIRADMVECKPDRLYRPNLDQLALGGPPDDDQAEDFELAFPTVPKTTFPFKPRTDVNPEIMKVIAGLPVDIKEPYWKRKARAMERFKEDGLKRPQDEDRSFLLYRRQINNGVLDQVWTNNDSRSDAVKDWTPNLQNSETNELPILNYKHFVFLGSHNLELLPRMLTKIMEEGEVALDLEGHDLHSYLGMTCLLQLSTKAVDFVVDAIQLAREISDQVKSILESPAVVKVVFGGDNDFLWLKRDFDIQLIGAIDVQTLLHQICLQGKLDIVIEKLPNGKAWFEGYFQHKYDDLSQQQRQNLQRGVGNKKLSYQSCVNLFFPQISIDKDAQLADWRIRSGPSFKLMLDYARNDVHPLLRVYWFLKSLHTELSPCFELTVQQTKLALLRKYVRKIPESPFAAMQKYRELSTDQQEKFILIHKFREYHARIIDESPAAILSNLKIRNVCTTSWLWEADSTAEQVLDITGKFSESISTWQKPLLRLLHQKNQFFESVLQLECHNCLKLGHAAWGCDQPYSQQNVAAFMAKHPDKKSKQNHRRQVNKRKNAAARKNLDK